MEPASRTHRFRKPALIGVAALVCALTVGGGTVAAMTKTVTITVDGSTRQVVTLAGSVDGALAAAGLTVEAHDALAPAGAASISEGSKISLNRGREFSVLLDGKRQTVWTTARTVDEALAELGRNPADYQLSANRSRAIPLDGLQVTGAWLHTVSMTGPSVKSAGVTSAARTVGELLEEQGVTLGRNDRVSPAVWTVLTDGTAVTVRTLPTVLIADGNGRATARVSDLETVGDLLQAQHVTVGKDDLVTPSTSTRLQQGLKITITRVGYQLVTKTQAVTQPADQIVPDDAMDIGTTTVVRRGHAGALQISYRRKLVNGKPGAPQEVSRKNGQAGRRHGDPCRYVRRAGDREHPEPDAHQQFERHHLRRHHFERVLDLHDRSFFLDQHHAHQHHAHQHHAHQHHAHQHHVLQHHVHQHHVHQHHAHQHRLEQHRFDHRVQQADHDQHANQ